MWNKYLKNVCNSHSSLVLLNQSSVLAGLRHRQTADICLYINPQVLRKSKLSFLTSIRIHFQPKAKFVKNKQLWVLHCP